MVGGLVGVVGRFFWVGCVAGLSSSTGAMAERGSGRPVAGGIRLMSPEVAMGSGSGVGAGGLEVVECRHELFAVGRGDGVFVHDLVGGFACGRGGGGFGGRFRKGRGYGSGGFHGGDFLLLVGLFGDAELVLHLHAELVGGAAELAHELAELTGSSGSFFGPKRSRASMAMTLLSWKLMSESHDTAYVGEEQMDARVGVVIRLSKVGKSKLRM